ncbi:unnamed protein product [Calicophoron daubneyi]|uniref:Beta-1,4-N-acetylgalactosaminyltransferase bre-4 n=1 Tax=Calicophoron daubneyi TaxID=300641 RepID=A0AAV2TK64_CALDB
MFTRRRRWLVSPRQTRRILILVFLLLTIFVFFRTPTVNLQSVPSETPVHISLRLKLNYLLTNELTKLLRQNVPTVDDVGEAISKEWFDRQKQFCKQISQNRSHHFSTQPCLDSCRTDVLSATKRNVIVIPFRARHRHLVELLPHIEKLLEFQKVCYLIVVAEQAGDQPFNKGILMNSAFVQSLNWLPFHCVTFHDVDLIPLSIHTPYDCPVFPRHTSVRIDKFYDRLPYVELIGGVLSVPIKAYLRVNGFSNLYWGWGAEDDDMFERSIHSIVFLLLSDPITIQHPSEVIQASSVSTSISRIMTEASDNVENKQETGEGEEQLGHAQEDEQAPSCSRRGSLSSRNCLIAFDPCKKLLGRTELVDRFETRCLKHRNIDLYLTCCHLMSRAAIQPIETPSGTPSTSSLNFQPIRLMVNGIPVTRPEPAHSQFRMLHHSPSPAFPVDLRSQILSFSKVRHRLDGLNSLNFTILEEKAFFSPGTNQYEEWLFQQEGGKLTKPLPMKSNRSHWLVHMKVDVGKAPEWLD